jgi:hypothetical protein
MLPCLSCMPLSSPAGVRLMVTLLLVVVLLMLQVST